MKLFKIPLLLASLFLYSPVCSMEPADGLIKKLADTLGDMNLYEDGDFSGVPEDVLKHIFSIRYGQPPWKKIGQILEFRTICKRWYLVLVDINAIAKLLKIPPLHCAAALRHTDEIITLTLGGASLLEPDDEGFRPAHYAIGVRGDSCSRSMLRIARALVTASQEAEAILLAVDDVKDEYYKIVDPEDIEYSEQDFIDVMETKDVNKLKKMLNNNTSIHFRPSFFECIASSSSQECINLVKYATIGRLQYKIFELLRKLENVPKEYFQHLKFLNANLNIYDEEGRTLLSRASRRNRHLPTFQELLAYDGVDVNLCDKKDGSTPLLKAVSEGYGYTSRIKALLAAKGCDVNCADHVGDASLHYLVRDDSNIELIKQFLNISGCNIDIQNLHGATPLMNSVCSGQFDCMKLFIDKGANMMTACIHGDTLLHIAAQHGRKRCLQELLKSLKHMVNSKNKYGVTPLYLAIKHGHIDCAKMLIEAGALVNIKDNKGETALHYAAVNGRTKYIALLAEHGADINCVSNADNICKSGIHFGQFTPLHYAAYDGKLDAVKILVKCGADVRLKTQLGKTARDLALECGHQKIVDFLKRVKHPGVTCE